MAPRKFAKLSSISTSREAFPDTDDEDQPNKHATERVKLTSRLVDRDVRASFRVGKTTRFTEDDEEIEIPSYPFSISSAQSQNFAAWINSTNGKQDLTSTGDYDDYDCDYDYDYDVVSPSGRNTNPTDGIESDGGSTNDEADEAPMEHDIADYVADREAQVRRSLRNPLFVLLLIIPLTRLKLCSTGFLYETPSSMSWLVSMASRLRRTARAAV